MRPPPLGGNGIEATDIFSISTLDWYKLALLKYFRADRSYVRDTDDL